MDADPLTEPRANGAHGRRLHLTTWDGQPGQHVAVAIHGFKNQTEEVEGTFSYMVPPVELVTGASPCSDPAFYTHIQ